MATYGRGVHAYFNGQVQEADRLLSEVIHGGSTDPRVYYFRAMARMRAGRTQEAESDMQVGAAFEARNPGFGSTVSRALQRVQGPHRRKLEEFRRQGRLNQLGEQRMLNQNRYEQLKRREPKVLRQEVKIPLEQLTDPSGAGAGNSKGPSTESRVPPPPSVTKEPEPADPFGDSEETEDEGNPFGGSDEAMDDDFFSSSDSDSSEADPFTSDNGFEDEGSPFESSNETESDASGTTGELGQEDKVEPGTLVGILGRLIVNSSPTRGFSIPMPSGPGFGPEAGGAFDMEGDFGSEEGFGDDGFSEEGFGEDEGDMFSDEFGDASDSDSPFGDEQPSADEGDMFSDDFGDASDSDSPFGEEESSASDGATTQEDETEDIFGEDSLGF